MQPVAAARWEGYVGVAAQEDEFFFTTNSFISAASKGHGDTLS